MWRGEGGYGGDEGTFDNKSLKVIGGTGITRRSRDKGTEAESEVKWGWKSPEKDENLCDKTTRRP